MLNTLRKNLKSLSWVLWLTVASFIIAIFAVWGGGGGAGGGTASWMAKIDGQPVAVHEFQDAYRGLDRFYRQIYQGNYDPRTLGVARQALDQLIRNRLILQEAERIGLQASPREISQAITQNPTFQVDGRFMGVEAYQRFLREQGIDVADYEHSVGRELLGTKYRRLVTDSVTVSSDEVREEYVQRNEKVRADYFVLGTEDLAAGVQVEDSALREFFATQGDRYLTLERRRAAYVLINAANLGGLDPVSDEEARAYYDDNLESRYSRPEQVRASQILLGVPQGATAEQEAEVRTRAEDLLLRIQAGEDFAELARSYSEHSTQTLGGDMGFFGRGSMRPEFEQAAFSLAVGEVSEILRGDQGFQIVKVMDRRDASVQPFSEVRDTILRQLEFSRSQDAVSQATNSFRDQVQADPTQFTVAAERLALPVEDTGLMAADGSVEALGAFPQVSLALFQLAVGQTSAAIALPQGTVFLQAKEIRTPEPLSFEAAREQVEADYRRSEGVLAARRRVEEARGTVDNLADLAKKLDATVESTTEFTRRQPVAPFSPEARRQAFASTVGEIAEPMEVPEGLLVFAVTEQQGFEATEFDAAKDDLRRSLEQRRRNLLFSTLVDQLQADSQVQINQALLDQIEGRT
jgi:peptidyl-prolyl cis-trans isomerase D